MKRVAIFASYSKDGIIPEYVLYYLQGLKMVAEEIVFVADSDVQPGEEDKLKGLVRYSKCGRHGCYDFGSYRIGFEWAEKNGVLDDADELILCNDSCYGPAYPFEKVFAEMNKKECDFWGMVESHEMKTHLQSYFLVFKKAVFQSSSFKEYVHSFEKQEDFWGYVKKYETNFAGHLSEAGFTFASYINPAQYEELNNGKPINPTVFPIKMLEDGMPLIKRKIFGCKYCPVLRDLPGNFLKAVESVNKELFEIILRDVGQGVAQLNDRPIMETLSQYRKHVNKLEEIREDQQAHIANLEELIKNQQAHIANLEKIRSEQDEHLYKRHKKNIMLIWSLIFMFIASVFVLSIICISL